MKLHRRTVRADGREFTVITLRPGAAARYATNVCHGTWHVLSDRHGAAVLARLLWGLSYQRRPGTVVVIDRAQLDPNPFDAEPSDPIVLVPSNLTPMSTSAARSLRHRLDPPGPSEGTVRWNTAGMDGPLAELRGVQDALWVRPGERTPETITLIEDYRRGRRDPDDHGGRVDRIGGLLAIIGPPSLLRYWALQVAILGDHWYEGMDYTELVSPADLGRIDGEVQIFPDYAQRVAAARVTRAEVLADADPSLSGEDVRELVYDRSDAVRARSARRAAVDE